MKALILAALVAALPLSAQAAGWTDNGDGTWTVSVPITVSTAEKDKFEQIRADNNWRYRHAGDALDASTWLEAVLRTYMVTKPGSESEGGVVAGYCAQLWVAFKRSWLSPTTIQTSSDFGDTEALAVSVPAPVPAP